MRVPKSILLAIGVLLIDPTPGLVAQTAVADDNQSAQVSDEVLPSPGLGDADDGFEYTITKFKLQWRWDHSDLPSLESILNTPIALTRTSQGWIKPRPGHITATTLAILNQEEGGVFWSSALGQMSATISNALVRDGLLGVFVTVDAEQIAPAGAENQGADLRPESDRSLTFVMSVGRVSEVRTIASGDRIEEEERINHPSHQNIIEGSPLQGDVKDAEGNDVPGDLLRRKTLEDYFLFLSRHPGRNVETSVAASSQPGGVSLDFLVMENKPLSLFVELSNTGTQQEGYFRQRYGLFHSQLTGNDDTLSLEYMTSDFDRSNAFFGKYESPFADNERMQWSIAGDWSQFVADEFGVLNDAFSGDSWSITGNITANIHQDGAFFLDLVGGLRIQNVAVENNLLNTNGSEDFLIPFVMLEADHLGDWSNFTGSLGLEFNVLGHDQDDLVTLGRFDPADYWARMNWSFAYWTFLEPLLNPSGWNDPSTPETSTLAHELMLYFGGQFAFNSRLLPQFQYVMGGMYSVRGYPQSVAAGDTGMVGKIEYRYHLPRAFAVNPEPIELFGSKFRAAPQHVYGRPDWDLMLCTFLDVGVTEQSHPLFFEDNDTLVGTGVGLEFIYRQNLRFRLDWGFPLKDMESAGVKVGDERLYVSGSIIF